jgi:hypothetical protein
MNINSGLDDLISIDPASLEQDFYLNYRYISAKAQSHREKIELDGRKQFFNLRIKWSWTLIVWISFILIFDSILIIIF